MIKYEQWHCREFYKSSFWRELSRACKERDNYTCRNCGKPAETSFEKSQLHAHHIVSRKPFPYRTGLDILVNLKTLCLACHSLIHKRDLSGRQPKGKPKFFRAKRMWHAKRDY
jgi:5-methylcytosine-specific restriction endonuclease McrA